jgi:DNA-binding LacI/PurR family transcriptional regulator
VSEADYVDLLLQQGVSGVIFSGGLYAQADAPHGHYRRLAERKLPTVLVNAGIDGLGFPHVSCDDSVAIEQAMGHLYSLGHTRIGLLIGPRDHMPSRRKLERARRFAADAGFQLGADDVAHALYSLEAAQAAAMRLLSRGITGIVCASDPMALGAIRAVRRAGLKVPDDVSVVGFDDSALMNCTDPPLTTVRQPIDAMGRMVIELLIAQISGANVPHDEFLFEPELVVRGSTGPVSSRA